MPRDYRLYCFDGAGRITAADWIIAANDAEAVVVAWQRMTGTRCEVWEKDRLVGRYRPKGQRPDAIVTGPTPT